jgi:hypothetical protein
MFSAKDVPYRMCVSFIRLLLTCACCKFLHHDVFTLPAVRGLARRGQVVRPLLATDSRGGRINILEKKIKSVRSTNFKLSNKMKGSVKKSAILLKVHNFFQGRRARKPSDVTTC